MRAGPPFRTLFHADWSVDPRKRWVTRAVRQDSGWFVTVPNQVVEAAELVNALFTAAGPVLAGFDFPIGVPIAYVQRIALADFPAALNAFGHGKWADFYRLAATPEEISIRRPFYPLRAMAGVRQSHLIRALWVDGIDLLRRIGSVRLAGCRHGGLIGRPSGGTHLKRTGRIRVPQNRHLARPGCSSHP